VLTYPIEVRILSEGQVAITFPDLPDAWAWGKTPGEAFGNALIALEEAIASRIEACAEIPKPSRLTDTSSVTTCRFT
jgi:predicted RNase H-like HicB family nuclease